MGGKGGERGKEGWGAEEIKAALEGGETGGIEGRSEGWRDI